MSKQQPDDGGPAYPSHPDSAYAGMTLRQWYAGLAMQGLCANKEFSGCGPDDIAEMAFDQADAMFECKGAMQ